MPREGKRTITVDEDTARKLKQRKKDRETWDDFLLRGARAINPDHDAVGGTPLVGQEELHLVYDSRTESGYEIYFYPTGENYVALPPEEQRRRKYRDSFESDGFNVTLVQKKDGKEEWVLEE